MEITKSTLPTYEVKLPSGKEVTIRPFTVKEEKILLMAMESGETKDIILAVNQIVANCILTQDIKVETLPFFDIDYLLIALRAKSIGESIEIRFKCNNLVDDKECGNIFPANIDIGKCKIRNPGLNAKIRISNAITVKLKYPTYAAVKMIDDNDLILAKKVALIANSIEYIQNKDQVIMVKELSREELYEFVEGLTTEQFDKLAEFVSKFPSFYVETVIKCDKCGFDHRLEYDDFLSFFG